VPELPDVPAWERAVTATMETDVLARLKSDSRYFIERFLFVLNKQRQKVPFRLNAAQSRYYAARTNADLILKARKEGFSTFIEADFLHGCIFGENENCVTMAHTWDDTVIHLDRVKFFLETMGLKDLRTEVTLDKENQRELFFPHSNSRYWIGTAGSTGFGRGRDITRLHLSEVAHYKDQKVLTGVMEACVSGAVKVLETTANGVGEAFHRLWKEAEDPRSGSPWKAHFFAWYEDPLNRVEKPTNSNVRLTSPEERMKAAHKLDVEQVLWYRQKRAAMSDKALMPQEYPSTALEAFLTSGRPAFNLGKLAEIRARAEKRKPEFVGDVVDDGAKVRFREDEEGAFKVYQAPRRGGSYLISADPAEGVPGGDFSVAQVIDRSSWQQVAVWRGRLNPGDFGRQLVKLGVYFNNAVLIPELNNNGWASVEAIKAERYPHLLNTREIWREGETPKDGFPTTEKTRTLCLTALRNAIDDSTMMINDVETINELETFVQNEDTGKFEAQDGCHDDCVMSLAIGAFCVKFLTVDATYGEHAAQGAIDRSPLSIRSVISQPAAAGARRRSATGYR
jgi:hypothetical protein